LRAHHHALAIRDDAQLRQRTRHARQRALERADRARHVAQPHVLVEQRLGRAQRDQVRECVGAPTAAAPARGYHAGLVQRAQTRRSEPEQARDLAAREQIGQRLAIRWCTVALARTSALAGGLHTPATRSEHDVDHFLVASLLPSHDFSHEPRRAPAALPFNSSRPPRVSSLERIRERSARSHAV
jgi:hypothetical protein